LAKYKIIHNDLHAGNVFIEYYPKPVVINYTFPKKFPLTSSYVATIYDWDHSSFRDMKNITLEGYLCKAVGECDRYTSKIDWYTILTWITRNFKTKPNQKIVDILGNLYDDKPGIVGHDAWIGHPCTCKKVESERSERCVRCTRKNLSKLCTPRQFLFSILKNN